MKTLVSPISQAAEPMGDGNAVDGELRAGGGGNFVHLGNRHGLVGFVVEVERAAIVGLIADAAVEGDDGAVGGRADVSMIRLRDRWGRG